MNNNLKAKARILFTQCFFTGPPKDNRGSVPFPLTSEERGSFLFKKIFQNNHPKVKLKTIYSARKAIKCTF